MFIHSKPITTHIWALLLHVHWCIHWSLLSNFSKQCLGNTCRLLLLPQVLSISRYSQILLKTLHYAVLLLHAEHQIPETRFLLWPPQKTDQVLVPHFIYTHIPENCNHDYQCGWYEDQFILDCEALIMNYLQIKIDFKQQAFISSHCMHAYIYIRYICI